MSDDQANTFIAVDRDEFKCRLWKKRGHEDELVKDAVYDIAVGMQGHKTPRGLYFISSKDNNPTWTIPNSPWAIEAGLKPGDTIPQSDPANPIKARWLGFGPPEMMTGFHGTGSLDSIGTAASHGCIRMVPDDVIELYDKVPMNAMVYIV